MKNTSMVKPHVRVVDTATTVRREAAQTMRHGKIFPLNERGLVGPMLASLIVSLAQRMRLSRRHTQEFLHDWLGIALSTSTINRCIHEAARAVEPLEAELGRRTPSRSPGTCR